jgi:hypothetical protein
VLCCVWQSGARTPQIAGDWWTIAGNPDLGPKIGSPKQGPVDFSIWQAKDGTWQLWSCIRATNVGGTGRLFYGWEGKTLFDKDWKPIGIKMTADTTLGETDGGLQAPHVFQHAGKWWMAYGDWEHICLAVSSDGKAFERVLTDGKSAIFGEGQGQNTRDAMVIKIGGKWHCYYTAMPNDQGVVFCRTSSDLKKWSESTVVAFGGSAGTNQWSSECPHVVQLGPREFYLFKTQLYGPGEITRVYRSADPMMFGINQDERYLVGTLPVAAPEIVRYKGEFYVAALHPNLDGIRVAKLAWR